MTFFSRCYPVLLILLAVAIGSTQTAASAAALDALDYQAALGPLYSPRAGVAPGGIGPIERGAMQSLLTWSGIALDASGLDHTPPGPLEARVFGEQLGPGRSSRAMAIVHIAMFEAINAISRRFQSYSNFARATPGASMEVATAQAAHDALVALYPSQRDLLDKRLKIELRRVRASTGKSLGITLGIQAARAILAVRANDRSAHAEARIGVDYFAGTAPGVWRQDPISQVPLALGTRWSEVTPFALTSADQFRAPQPPTLSSAVYVAAFNEVKALGGDGFTTPTVRTAEQTQVGIYWAYDGMPSLCAPPRLYNQIATQIARQMRSNVLETARLMALVNIAMADTGIASWESKYYYAFWRPVTGIRESDTGTGPSALGDGNPATQGDVTFTPLGAPASNLNGPNFTPPFPAYPSGHAAFGGALFHTLRLFYGRDDIAFSFISDEYNGYTMDNEGVRRPLLERRFSTLSQAEEENGQSRIYLGIHWSFDKTAGIDQGRLVADYVYQNILQPL